MALTDKALTGSPFHLEDLAHIAPGLEVAELPVLPGSTLIGRTLGDAEVGEETGAKVIGLWAKGEFVFSPGPVTRIGEGSVLVARRLNPEAQIVACASEEEMVGRMYQAGAHYVLALAVVGRRALAAHLLGRELLAFGKQIRIERVPAGRLAGQTVGGLRVRSYTGCTVLAVERGGNRRCRSVRISRSGRGMS